MAEGRSTAIEVEERISKVFQWNLKGYSRREILLFCSKEGWGVSDRQVQDYIGEAKRRLVEMNQDTQEEDLSRIISLHLANYRASEEVGDRQEMRKILECISKLKGLELINLRVKIDRPLKELDDTELLKQLTDGSSDI